MYVLLGCLHHSGSDMRKLHGDENDAELQAAWKRLDEQVLDYVVNLLRSQCLRRPYRRDQLDLRPGADHRLLLRQGRCAPRPTPRSASSSKWFYYSQIRARYTSQLPQKLDRDLRTLTESEQPFDDLLQTIVEEGGRLEIMPYEFEGRAIQHPLFSMVRWYLKSRGAVCLTTGIGLRQNMGKKYQLELDHIFPYSRLKKVGYGQGNRVKYALAQEFTNRAILTQVANRTKSTWRPPTTSLTWPSRSRRRLSCSASPRIRSCGSDRSLRGLPRCTKEDSWLTSQRLLGAGSPSRRRRSRR